MAEAAEAVTLGLPEVEVELEGVRNRLWRLPGEPPAELADAQQLIADGHHRYETTLAFHEEEGTERSAWLLAVVVPTVSSVTAMRPPCRCSPSSGPEPGGYGPMCATTARSAAPGLVTSMRSRSMPRTS